MLATRDFLVTQGSDPDVHRCNDSEYQPNTATVQKGTGLFNVETNFFSFFVEREDNARILLSYFKATPDERKHYLATGGKFATQKLLDDPSWKSPNPDWRNFEETLSGLFVNFNISAPYE